MLSNSGNDSLRKVTSDVSNTALLLPKEFYVVIVDINSSDWCPLFRALPHWTAAGSISRPELNAEGVQQSTAMRRDHQNLPLSFQEMWAGLFQLLFFVTLGWPRITILIYTADSCDACLLFQGTMESITAAEIAAAVTRQIGNSIKRATDQHNQIHGDSLLGPALGKALCFLNGTQESRATFKACILIVDVAPATCYSTQASPLINAAFAARHQGISINVCSVGTGAAPSVCEQLADVTSGVALCYSEVSQNIAQVESPPNPRLAPDGFGAFLMFHFAPLSLTSSDSATTLMSAWSPMVAASVPCVCHQRNENVVLVCSCCLAVYCHAYKDTRCSVCRVDFTESDRLTISDVTIPKDPTRGNTKESL